jgi:hypothetical protein
VTGEIFGNLYFTGTGSGTGSAELYLYENSSRNSLLRVKSGGVIKYFPNTGNTTTANGPYLIMENGSTYEINKSGGTFPQGVWQSNSLAKATSPGAAVPVFNGNIYGNLEWNCPSQTNTLTNFFNKDIQFNNVTLVNTNIGNANGEIRIAAGSSAVIPTLIINGNLEINTNARLVLTSATVTSGNGGSLNLSGNMINNGALTTEGVSGTVNVLRLNGAANQSMTNTGTISGTEMDLIMNNSEGATLLTPLTLPGNTANSLQLMNGKITTTAINLLTMIDNAGYTGGSATSFINGPMKKIGNDNFTFPVGKGSIYAPIGIIIVSGETTADEFTAEYKRTNPQSIHGLFVESGMNHVSYVEYWTLTRDVGLAVKRVSLDVHLTSFCKALISTYVSRWNGISFWTNEGSTNAGVTIIPPYEIGVITSVNTISGFGDFTLITDLPFAVNPLPVVLKSFDAFKANGKSEIKWELTECCSKDALFEVQRSTDKRNFTTIKSVSGSETNRFYSADDKSSQTGIVYYRLKITDYDGSISYSKVVAVIHSLTGLYLTALSPNPAQSSAMLSIVSAKQEKMELIIVDLPGRTRVRKRLNISKGNTNHELNLVNFAAGNYIIFGISANGKTNSIQFSKL